MKPSLYYPVYPYHVNQGFGNNIPCVKDFNLPTESIVDGDNNETCPVGYEKLYGKFGMLGHNGTDLQAGEQDIYAAYGGTVIEKQTMANLGLGLGVISPVPLDLGANGVHYLKIRYWHLKSFDEEVGAIVQAGDIIGISDNTGYSSGDHLHFEGVPMDKDHTGNYVATFPNNGYAGAIDISPYFNNYYAQDIPKLNSLETALVAVLQKLLAYYQDKLNPQSVTTTA